MKNSKRSKEAYTVTFIYGVILSVAMFYHEPWADETQAWLLARDSDFMDLFIKHLRYEGSPGLWHLILMIPAKLGLGIEWMYYITFLVCISGTFILVKYSPFKRWIRILLPFTFYLMYQYSVIARSYVLIAPLLYLIAIVYPNRFKKKYMYTLLLVLLSQVSLHGAMLAICIYFMYMIEASIENKWRNICKKYGISIMIFSLDMLFIFCCLYPPKDLGFANGIRFGFIRSASLLSIVITDAFAGNWFYLSKVSLLSLGNLEVGLMILGALLSVVLFYWSVKYFQKQGKLSYFLLPFGLLYLVYTLKHISAWHLGIVFLLWIFVYWISSEGDDVGSRSLEYALLSVLIVQMVWSYQSINYDINANYSSSLNALEKVKELVEENASISGSAYYNTALLPYFDRNIYNNLNEDVDYSFWKWNQEMMVIDLNEDISTLESDYLLISERDVVNYSGMKFSSKNYDLSEYRLVDEFKGGLFWKNHIIEDDSFSLYERVN